MAKTKKSNFKGSGYQKALERIAILENATKEAIDHLDKITTIPKVAEAKQILLAAWIREVNL